MKLELVENEECENKVKLDGKNYQQWLKTLCAFSNSDGGTLNVGVSDDLELIGFTLREVDQLKRMVETVCRNHTKPIVKCKFEEVEIDKEKNRFYLKISVSKRKSTITWLVDSSTSPLLYVRHNGSTDLATIEEQTELLTTSNLYEYDKVETGIRFSDAEFEDLKEEYEKKNDEILTKKKMISFGLMTSDDYLTIAGILFSDRSISKNANMTCTTWPSLNKGSKDYIDSKSYTGSLISLIYDAIAYVSSVTYFQFGGEKVGLHRVDTGSFSLLALREAIVNALAHRDYKIDGNEIAINCFPDRIEITSPGSMLQSKENLIRIEIDPNAYPSARRNHTICTIFEKCKLMENKGSGFEFIVEDYKGLGEDYRPLISSNRVSFTIILKNKKYQYNNELTKNSTKSMYLEDSVKKSYFLSRQNLYYQNPRYREIEAIIASLKSVTISEISNRIHLSKDGVKYNIRKMKDACLIRRVSGGYERINDVDRPSDYLSLDKETLMKAIEWCQENFIRGEEACNQYTSFEFKKVLEKRQRLFLTNGQFKAVMLYAGFEPLNMEALNWTFKIDKTSPVLKMMEKDLD